MSLVKPVILALLAAMVAGLAAHQVFGTPLIWAIAFALPVGALALLTSMLSGMADANWEAVPADVTGRPDLHASTLAIRFAEAANDPHRFRTRVVPRLRRLALATLRARPGTEDLSTVDDPRVRAVLGDELYVLLTDENAEQPPPGRLAVLLDRLENT